MSIPPFPPSFSSFPDFEQSSSQEAFKDVSSSKPSDDKKRKKRRHSKERKSSSDRTTSKRDKSRHKSPSRKERHAIDDDGYSTRRTTDVEQTKHLFYSDRKGDIQNIHYGKLHTGDIPKYRLVSGTCALKWDIKHLITNRWQECTWPPKFFGRLTKVGEWC